MIQSGWWLAGCRFFFTRVNFFLKKIKFLKIFLYLAVPCPSCRQDLQSSKGITLALTKNRTQAPTLGAQSLSHWATRKVPRWIFLEAEHFMKEIIFLFVCSSFEQLFVEYLLSVRNSKHQGYNAGAFIPFPPGAYVLVEKMSNKRIIRSFLEDVETGRICGQVIIQPNT